jgi:hypothetical protein
MRWNLAPVPARFRSSPRIHSGVALGLIVDDYSAARVQLLVLGGRRKGPRALKRVDRAPAVRLAHAGCHRPFIRLDRALVALAAKVRGDWRTRSQHTAGLSRRCRAQYCAAKACSGIGFPHQQEHRAERTGCRVSLPFPCAHSGPAQVDVLVSINDLVVQVPCGRVLPVGGTGAELFREFGIDPFSALSESQRAELQLSFAKRHVIAHNQGMVDAAFVKQTGTGVVGRPVTLSADEVRQCVANCSAVLRHVERTCPELRPSGPGEE